MKPRETLAYYLNKVLRYITGKAGSGKEITAINMLRCGEIQTTSLLVISNAQAGVTGLIIKEKTLRVILISTDYFTGFV